LDPKLRSQFTAFFERIDTNHNGELDKGEFRAFLKLLNEPTLKPNLFFLIDTDHNGTISLDEFLNWSEACWEIGNTGNVEKWMRMAFDACDIGRKGHLTRTEFFKFMKYNGRPVSMLRRRKIFAKFDVDKNGTVDFDEIMMFIEGVK
jgi:Ca2+-binding EF-hand superfamily protein